ncbi:V-type proton ATPase subunit F-like [Camellia sinensis]|uniref:V-type proton ATPase subunit F-like n=1 Tax=Camellia sinensis TaxID=4442 RepID=UPI001035F5E1|nr:V-type proton ATPase subunit F-like [Camellia sinensis]
MAAGGAQTNSTTRSNPAEDARLPAVGGLGGLGLPEMFGSMQDTASLSQFAQNPAVSQMMQVLLSNPQYMNQDTIIGFLLAGVGNVDLRRKTNYLIVDSKTTVKQIEEAFKEFTTREDVVIVMISQYVANMIKFLVDSYNNPIPAILEIPSKDHPYDPTHDSVLSKC